MLIIPVQKEKLGISLRIQTIIFEADLVSAINLRTKTAILPIAPTMKCKKKLTS